MSGDRNNAFFNNKKRKREDDNPQSHSQKIKDALPENTFSNIDFSEIDFSEIDFSEIDFSEIDFSEIDFSEIDFSNIDKTEISNLLAIEEEELNPLNKKEKINTNTSLPTIKILDKTRKENINCFPPFHQNLLNKNIKNEGVFLINNLTEQKAQKLDLQIRDKISYNLDELKLYYQIKLYQDRPASTKSLRITFKTTDLTQQQALYEILAYTCEQPLKGHSREKAKRREELNRKVNEFLSNNPNTNTNPNDTSQKKKL